jgi:hypothetical protein
MAAEDEILRAYEAEFEPRTPDRNRGFWLVAGALLAAGTFLVVEILAHRPLADAIGHAQSTLRIVEGEALEIQSETGGFTDADAAGLVDLLPELTFRPAREASTGLDDVSVAASDRTWAAAVRARAGACFYLRLDVGGEPKYGSGPSCTGEAALRADRSSW